MPSFRVSEFPETQTTGNHWKPGNDCDKLEVLMMARLVELEIDETRARDPDSSRAGSDCQC